MIIFPSIFQSSSGQQGSDAPAEVVAALHRHIEKAIFSILISQL